MWTLIIITLSHGYAYSTKTNLETCERRFMTMQIDYADVRQAYCQSIDGRDKVWMVKNGQTLP